MSNNSSSSSSSSNSSKSETKLLDHIIYSLIPYKGYGVRAWSRRDVVNEVEYAFKGWFSPYAQAFVRPGEELKAVVKAPNSIYMARVFVGDGLDELKRSGVVSHIALIPLDIATKLPLAEIDREMTNYTVSKGIGLGEIEPLRIGLVERYEGGREGREEGREEVDEDLEYLKKVVDFEKAEKILTAISKPESKIIVIFKRDIFSRARLVYALAKMFLMHKVTEYIITVEKPIDNILIEFTKTIIVLDKMFPVRSTEDWTVIKIGDGEKEGKVIETDIRDTLKRIGYKVD
jgi:hypothetical protein